MDPRRGTPLDFFKHGGGIWRRESVLVRGADRRQFAGRVRHAHFALCGSKRLAYPGGQRQSLGFGVLFKPTHFFVVNNNLQPFTHRAGISNSRE